ncbi:MAG: cobaltochelatase subunit CobN, partial [Bradyrhizobiaceae bacterium]|nr:cobaltochelatase subunit CobN [Bradyrhizobiaceae bacterium]
MHLLTTTSTTLDDIVEPVDLRQPPGDVIVLSFADSDLTSLAAAWESEKASLPRVRLAHLRDLRHPMSVDLWIDQVGVHAKIVVVRLLGGLEWWRYGIERLSLVARERGIVLALLPGEDGSDPRLAEASTLPADELEALLRFFREGGRENMRILLHELARYAGTSLPTTKARAAPKPVPRTGGYLPAVGAVDLDTLAESLSVARPVVPIIFYRSMLLAGDMTPINDLHQALTSCGLAPAPLFVTSLKDAEAAAFIGTALTQLKPAVVITTTAFAAAGGTHATALAGVDSPILQAVIATTKRAVWRDSVRGLGAADLAMHVVLPELDGRLLAGAIAFKDALSLQADLAFAALVNRPESDRVAMVAARVAALVRLQLTPRAERRIGVLMPDYPHAPGRAGYAVGLDVPASLVAMLSDLAAAGYSVVDGPRTPNMLLDGLRDDAGSTLALGTYTKLLAEFPAQVRARMNEAWGEPADDPDVRDGAFHFRARTFGNVTVALPPDRGSVTERRANYHDPALPPRHTLLAFGLWLRHSVGIHALVHMGAHGTLE